MNNTNLIIVGSSGHAKVVIDIFEKQGQHNIIGLLDDYRKVNETTLGYPVVGGLNDLETIAVQQDTFEIFVAVGDNWARQKVVEIIRSKLPEIKFANAIHPSVQIGKGVSIGKGVAMMAHVTVNPDSSIGDFCFLNTNSSADHDVHMAHFSSLGPGVTVGGNVSIGEFTALSIGATTKEKLKIGKHSIIGAGALLLSNAPDQVIMYGVPAKVIRERAIGEAYV